MPREATPLRLVSDPSIELPDGSTARRVGDALELRDRHERLVFRFHDGKAELSVPEGDLEICAPNGAVRITSATDIELSAHRDLVQRSARCTRLTVDETELSLEPRRAKLRGRKLEVVAQHSQLTTGVGRLIANHLQASAETLVTRVERYELLAERVVERSHTAIREVSDLLQTHSGRVRSFVGGVFAMYSDRTVLVSKKDTSIDGEKVLLG